MEIAVGLVVLFVVLPLVSAFIRGVGEIAVVQSGAERALAKQRAEETQGSPGFSGYDAA